MSDPTVPDEQLVVPLIGGPRRRVALLAGVTVGVVVLIAAVAVGLWLRSGPSQADAQRECRTAVRSEFDRRLKNNTAAKNFVVTVTGIDLDDTTKTSSGYRVDFTVHYAATDAVGQVPNTLPLTCNAKVDGGKLTTEVVNRS